MRHDKNVVLWIIPHSGVTLGQAPRPLCYQELRFFSVFKMCLVLRPAQCSVHSVGREEWVRCYRKPRPKFITRKIFIIRMLKRGTVSVEWQLVAGLLPEAAYTAGWKLESHQKDLVKF